MTEEIKPCPFCGGGKIRFCDDDVAYLGEATWIAVCKCGACGPNRHTQEEAAEAWNARAEPEEFGIRWAVRTAWNPVAHIFHDKYDACRFAAEEKTEVVRVKIVRAEG